MTKTYHFIGIGGIGMSALAHMMLKKNYCVSGSDLEINPRIESLIKEGAIVYKGQSEHHIHCEMIVVYSSDINKNNPEFVSALEKKCQLMHRSDLLAYLSKDKKSLAIAGTHGKTTTSALLSCVLVGAKLDPSYAIGGVLKTDQTNSRTGNGEHFVIEADESDQTFLKYSPDGAIITNIDHDHLINYDNNFDCLIAAFKQFSTQVQCAKCLFWCGDDKHLRSLNLPGHSYGFDPQCAWHILNVKQEGFELIFDVKGPHTTYKAIILSAIGLHNVLNAAAVFGLALTLGINEKDIRSAFREFEGIQRRCEKKGVFKDILFLDDYAHHPTEITTTLQGIRKAIDKKRLVAVFQPHRYTRTLDCLGKFKECFEHVDQVIITDIYAAGELPISNLNSQKIVSEINENHTNCSYVPRSALVHQLSQLVNAHDVVVTLGAGDITKISYEVMILLEKQAGTVL